MLCHHHRHPERSEAEPRDLLFGCCDMKRSLHYAAQRAAPVGMTE
jgi:hypothetical protein